MDFDRLLEIVGNEPVFETGVLLAGDVDPDHVRRQLSRWTNAGRVYQLKRGLYALAPPYQAVKPHPFHVANRMVPGSYVSLQSALAYYSLIPEYVPTVLSVSTARPNTWDTPLGDFSYRHIKPDYLHGYSRQDLSDDQSAFVATPEKALLDLVYLTPGGDSPGYLQELRLQNVDRLSPEALMEAAAIFGRPKIRRAVDEISALFSDGMESLETQ